MAGEDVPTKRSNHAAAVCGDHLLVFGGWGDATNDDGVEDDKDDEGGTTSHSHSHSHSNFNSKQLQRQRQRQRGTKPLAAAELLHLKSRCWTHCSTVNEARSRQKRLWSDPTHDPQAEPQTPSGSAPGPVVCTALV